MSEEEERQPLLVGTDSGSIVAAVDEPTIAVNSSGSNRMVLGYAIGYAYSTTAAGWRSVYGWSSVLAVVMCIGMTWIVPSSARWLAMKGRINEARHSLLFVRPLLLDQDQEMENLREIAARVAENDPANDTLADDWVRFTSPAIFPAMVHAQVSGQPSVLYYADSLFEDVGMIPAALPPRHVRGIPAARQTAWPRGWVWMNVCAAIPWA
eukprot:gene29555-38673_t